MLNKFEMNKLIEKFQITGCQYPHSMLPFMDKDFCQTVVDFITNTLKYNRPEPEINDVFAQGLLMHLYMRRGGDLNFDGVTGEITEDAIAKLKFWFKI